MELLSDKHIDEVYDILVKRGITYRSLRDDLLDHICCLIENKMDQGETFERALHQSIVQFGPQGIERTQEATIHLLTLKLRKMKKFVSILGLLGGIITAFGALGKPLHLPGSGLALVLGVAILTVIYIPTYVGIKIQESQDRLDKLRYAAGAFSAIALGIGMLFALMYWPGAKILLYTGMTLTCLAFIPLYFIRAYKTADNKLMSASFVVVVLAAVLVSFGMSTRGDSHVMQNSYFVMSQQHAEIIESSATCLEQTDARYDGSDALMNASSELINYISHVRAELIDIGHAVRKDGEDGTYLIELHWNAGYPEIARRMTGDGELNAAGLYSRVEAFLNAYNTELGANMSNDDLHKLIQTDDVSSWTTPGSDTRFDKVTILPVVMYLDQLTIQVNYLTAQALIYTPPTS